MRETVLVHFSDVHAFTLAGASPWAFLSKRLAGAVNLATRRRNRHPVALFESLVRDVNRVGADHVVVTGDLVSLSLPGEFALARRILDGLDAGPRAVTVVPGNHDAYVWTAWLGAAFQRAFAPYATSDDDAAGAATRAADDDARSAFPIVRVRGELAIVGLSTALPSPVPLADGWVGGRQLARLEEALVAHRGRFRVVALHHPPYDNRHAVLRGLRDRAALQRVLARAGAELVLHGHEHRELYADIAGPDGRRIPVAGVASGTYDDPRADRRARYNVYRIRAGAIAAVETRVHDPATGAWRPEPRPAFDGTAWAAAALPAQAITTPA